MSLSNTQSAILSGQGPTVTTPIPKAPNWDIKTRSVGMFCLIGLFGILAPAAWSAVTAGESRAVSLGESRAETQAAHWLERALPDSGPGLEELRRGIRKFDERDYQAALGNFTDARRLAARGHVEEAAVFLSAESRARSAVGSQDVRAVILSLEETRRRYPQSPRALWALWRIGSLFLRLGFEHEAIGRFEQLLRSEEANPLLPFVRLDLADVYIAQGRHGPAGKILRLVRKYPPDPESLGLSTVGLGDIAHAQGQYRQARELYEEVDAQWPKLLQDRAVSLFGMGDTYLRLGEWPRALHFLNTGYALHPREPIAAQMLARMADGLKLSGQLKQAQGLYRTVVERHPGTDGELSAWVGLGQIAEKEALSGAPEADVQEAYGVILKRWLASPMAAEALLHLAQSHQRAGEIEQATAAYDGLLRRGDSGPWRSQGRQGLETTLRGLSAAGDILEIANVFLRHQPLLTSPPVNGPTGLLIAGALTRLGLIDSAITIMKVSLAAGGIPVAQQEYGLMVLTQAYRTKGDLHHLEERSKEYLRKHPQGAWSEEARDGLMIALSRADKQDEAAIACAAYFPAGDKKLVAASQKDSDAAITSEAVLLCADRLARAGHTGLAQQLYRQIIKNEPGSAHGVWASYQIARALQAANRSSEAADIFERVSNNDKDTLLAAASRAHLERALAPAARSRASKER